MTQYTFKWKEIHKHTIEAENEMQAREILQEKAIEEFDGQDTFEESEIEEAILEEVI